jgi:hypothetical protein
MPTARELLEQADALMRRNRGGDIPVLSEPVSEALSATLRGPTTRDRAGPHLSPEAESAAVLSTEAEDLTVALDRSLQDDVEPPVLTDVVEEVAVDIVPMPAAKSEEDWLGPDTVDPELHSITGPSPDTVAVVPPVTLRSASEVPVGQAAVAEMSAESAQSAALEIAEPAAALVPPEAVSSPGPTDDERWRALAEQRSMQVLQRVDLFVDTGLKAKLAAHLQPIVERAGNELVEAINDQVGQLVRSYVAEAIEREIAQWRQGQR